MKVILLQKFSIIRIALKAHFKAKNQKVLNIIQLLANILVEIILMMLVSVI